MRRIVVLSLLNVIVDVHGRSILKHVVQDKDRLLDSSLWRHVDEKRLGSLKKHGFIIPRRESEAAVAWMDDDFLPASSDLKKEGSWKKKSSWHGLYTKSDHKNKHVRHSRDVGAHALGRLPDVDDDLMRASRANPKMNVFFSDEPLDLVSLKHKEARFNELTERLADAKISANKESARDYAAEEADQAQSQLAGALVAMKAQDIVSGSAAVLALSMLCGVSLLVRCFHHSTIKRYAEPLLVAL